MFRLSGFQFYVDGITHYDELCREILEQWNEVILPIPGTGTHTLEWSSVDGGVRLMGRLYG